MASQRGRGSGGEEGGRPTPLNRRSFLHLLLAAGCSACLPTRERRVLGATPTTVPGGRVWWLTGTHRSLVWLRMIPTSTRYGTIPTSEQDYRRFRHAIDVAMPTNGGRLQANGTWLQEGHKIDPEWPRALPGMARDAQHAYVPVVDNDRQEFSAFLESPGRWAASADRLVALALEERFDAPWDGVLLDFEGTPPTHRERLAEYYQLLCPRLSAAGLAVGISAAGRLEDDATHDLALVARLADFVDLRCYGYRLAQPRSIAPWWWIQGCVEFALAEGVRPEQLALGLGNFSKYWPNSGEGDFIEVSREMARQIVAEAGATLEWVERNRNGLVREHYATIGEGHIWIHEAETMRHGLALIDEGGLLGLSLFAPGMGNVAQWEVIEAWRDERHSTAPASPERLRRPL